MVTCEPSKQDKLSAHKSQQYACPLSLAQPAWQQKHQQRLPPPAHSNVSHIVWSRGLLCKSTVFFSSVASHTLSKTQTLVKVVLQCWIIFFFYRLWSLEVGLLHPYIPQSWFVNMLLMGGSGWFSGHGDLRRAEHGNHATQCQLQSWHIHEVWAATVMTPSHSAFVWPVLQPLWILKPIEWEGLPPLETITTNKQTRKQVPTAPTSKQLPTVTVWLVLISHKEVVHEAHQSLQFHPSQPLFSQGNWSTASKNVNRLLQFLCEGSGKSTNHIQPKMLVY